MSGVTFLELKDVRKIYASGDSEVRALDGVTLRVDRGEYVAIVGQSGSGKSTLMNILGCLDRPSSGSYHVNDIDVATLNGDELAALRCNTFGFIFQRYNLLANITAQENVEIPAIYAGRSRHERSLRAHELLTSLGLGNRAGHKPNQLSGGQQQRVSVARALMNDAEVILADEPTGALDSRSGKDVLALLDQLHAEGRTILLITHDQNVAAHAKRTIQLSDGKIASDSGKPQLENMAIAAKQPERKAGGISFRDDLSEAVKMALRSLHTNIFRTALTLLGVVIGVAAVVAMLAIGGGSKQKVLQGIEAIGTNLLLVRPGAPGMRSSGDIVSLIPADATAINELDNVQAAVPERSSAETLRYGNIDYRTSVKGSWPAYVTAREWAMDSGGFFTEDDLKGYAPVVVLGQTVAKNLFPDGENPLGKYVLIKNTPFEVIGVLASKGASPSGNDMDDIVVVPLSTGIMRLFGKQYVHTITVKVTDAGRLDVTQDAITKLLSERHRAEDFQIRNTASLLETAETTQNTLTVLLGSVAAISLIVGGIGVMNIMLVSVSERTKEIGIRMATGARMGNILLQFNTEAIVVCGIGGLAGVLLGLATALIVNSFGVAIALTPGPSLLAFLCAFITGLLFGYLPARKAAMMDPVAALATE
jgi:macrolide transport system ATP-binding/permease protein